MEIKYICSVTFDDAFDANVLVQKITTIDGERFVKNWRVSLAKNSSLNEPLHTSWGDLSWDEFPEEKAYILSKWQE